MFAPQVTVRFQPRSEGHEWSLPWFELQSAVASGMEPEQLARLFEDRARSFPPGVLRPEGARDGGYLVGEDVLFPRPSTDYDFSIHVADRPLIHHVFAPEHAPALADLLRSCDMQDPNEALASWPFDDVPPPSDLVRRPGEHRVFPLPDAPGIYRREHASLLVRSRTTGILLDPLALRRGLPHLESAPVPLGADYVQAVAITHSHSDHWHLPSLFAATPNAGVPVIVPNVPRTSLLCIVDFERVLHECDQAVRKSGWGTSFEIGDITVECLPFYGEQPTRDGPPLRDGLRSWGNCYRFDTEDFSCLVLVDGGDDPMGSIVEVARESRRRRGRVNVVLACQREFASPFFAGLEYFWAALPYARLRELQKAHARGALPLTTGGARGAALACAAADARFFMPYANGYAGPGQVITDIGWGGGRQSEAECNASMRAELHRRGAPTLVHDWCPGDAALFDKGDLSWRRWSDR